MILRLPPDALLVLIGPSGAGKSTFAARHFAVEQVISSDAMRAVVSGDPNDQTATGAAFELLHGALEQRLADGQITVVDATNVERWARARLLAAARRHQRQAVAIVLDLPLTACLERNRERQDRTLPEGAIRRQHGRMRASLATISDEGFVRVVRLSSVEAVDAARVEVVPA